MTAPEDARLRQLALAVLARRAGAAAGAEEIAAAVDRGYDDLVRVLTPIIGSIGVTALTDRTLHLVARDYPWLVPAPERPHAEQTFSRIIPSLKRQDPVVATEGAAAVLATFLGLLGTFIGQPLAARLWQQAWPDAPFSAHTEDT